MSFRLGPMELIGEGRSRTVYGTICGKWVLKCPIVEMRNCCCGKNQCSCLGYMDNIREASVYKNFGSKPDINDIRYAHCRMIPNTEILVMEKLTKTHLKFKEYPEWAGYVDCFQVGWSRNGYWVAFDFGW